MSSVRTGDDVGGRKQDAVKERVGPDRIRRRRLPDILEEASRRDYLQVLAVVGVACSFGYCVGLNS
jgi:hypothetical protein